MGAQAADQATAPNSAAWRAPPKMFQGIRRHPTVVALAALASVALLAPIAWRAQGLPSLVPTRVLVEGGDGHEVTATLLAEYGQPSWHGFEVDGGSCEASVACAGAACPVLRAAVLRPRSLGERRVSIKAVVTELWPMRVFRAARSGDASLAVTCTFAARVDVFHSGWWIQREVRWASDFSREEQVRFAVNPRGWRPSVQNSSLAVDGAYMLVAEVSPGSRAAQFLTSVPVTVRTEVGYAEKHETALRGHLAVDADLKVVARNGSQSLAAMLPFSVSTSASLPALAKYAATAVGRSAAATPTVEHALVFAAAPGASATGALLGGAHSVAWHRSVRADARRLAPSAIDFHAKHRLRIDEKDLLEVEMSVAGRAPTVLSLRLRTSEDGASFTDLGSASISTDKLLEPVIDVGGGSSDQTFETDFGNFAVSMRGEVASLTFEAPGALALNFSRAGEDFSFGFAQGFPGDSSGDDSSQELADDSADQDSDEQDSEEQDGGMSGLVALKSGALTGTLLQGGQVVAKLDGTVAPKAGGKPSDREVRATVTGEGLPEALLASADLAAAEELGGRLLGSLAWENGTALGSVNASLAASSSGSLASHALVRSATSDVPLVELRVGIDVAEGGCRQVSASLLAEGKREFSVEAGCTRSPEAFGAKAVIMTSESEPTMVNASVDVKADPVFGGRLTTLVELEGRPLVDASAVAVEDGAVRRLDVKTTRVFSGMDSYEFSFPAYSSTHSSEGPRAVPDGERVESMTMFSGGCVTLVECDPASQTATLEFSADCSSECGDRCETVRIQPATDDKDCAPVPWARGSCLVAKFTCARDAVVLGVKSEFSKPGAADVSLDVTVSEGAQAVDNFVLKGKALDTVLGMRDVDGRREVVVKSAGEWQVSINKPLEEASTNLIAGLAQNGDVVTFEVKAAGQGGPSMLSLVLDSSAADALAMRLVVGPEEQQSLKVNGRFTHEGNFSKGTLAISAGETEQDVDLRLSRGLVMVPGGYRFNLSASAMGVGDGGKLELKDAHFDVDEDWRLGAVGWGLVLSDPSGEQFAQAIEAAEVPVEVEEEKITGSMEVEVQGDVAAFAADPVVKRGFQTAIAASAGVPTSYVEVSIRASGGARRLEARRLAGTVEVSYEISVPKGEDAAAVASTLATKSTAEMTTAVSAAIAKEGGSAEYAMTVVSAKAPQASSEQIEEASGALCRGMWALAPLAVLHAL